MENEERIPVEAKKAWQTPEFVELDVDKTEKWYGLPEQENWMS